jgi:hypothetical protein
MERPAPVIAQPAKPPAAVPPLRKALAYVAIDFREMLRGLWYKSIRWLAWFCRAATGWIPRLLPWLRSMLIPVGAVVGFAAVLVVVIVASVFAFVPSSKPYFRSPAEIKWVEKGAKVERIFPRMIEIPCDPLRIRVYALDSTRYPSHYVLSNDVGELGRAQIP